MPSIADFHFPQMVWREGTKLLWNPIHKKVLKNRPEERVRLRIIEALIAAGWSKHRITTEEALKAQESPAGRTDIICYDQNFRPQILVECKAENVPISSDVAEQTARYNRTVGAPYLLMSNGITDHWYEISNQQSLKQLPSIPDLLKPTSQASRKRFSILETAGICRRKSPAQPA
ncbi:MAG: type I restriction enzyme HsdR N-terminal domain-containing protein [Balneolaceae bacterium]|nr:type I restriction enzyme HsdR N-terminal domain-containing protein [Balneolaceae bacterium]